MLITQKRLKLRTSNLARVFPGTVRTWPQKNYPNGGVARVTWPLNFSALNANTWRRYALSWAPSSINKQRCRRRHGMRPSFQLLRAAWRLEIPGHAHPGARSAGRWSFWRPVTLTFDLFIWKLALHLLMPWGTSMQIDWLLFCVRVRSRTVQTDGQTDGGQDG